jgi:deoxyuridine 5'-triphosphate nucleotidohydrolase
MLVILPCHHMRQAGPPDLILPPQLTSQFVSSRICVRPFQPDLPWHYQQVMKRKSGHDQGLALKYGITVANAPGTIDSDYRGEIAVILVNNGTDDFTITHGMRIAQMVIAAVTIMTPVEADDLDDTARAAGGFGSTGL